MATLHTMQLAARQQHEITVELLMTMAEHLDNRLAGVAAEEPLRATLERQLAELRAKQKAARSSSPGVDLYAGLAAEDRRREAEQATAAAEQEVIRQAEEDRHFTNYGVPTPPDGKL